MQPDIGHTTYTTLQSINPYKYNILYLYNGMTECLTDKFLS